MTVHSDILIKAPQLATTVSRSDFVAAMRRVANSVTVVLSEGAHGIHGATVSAFASVSADPPTVLVCLHKDSRIAEMVVANGQFSVNVLSQDAVEDALTFASADANARAGRLRELASDEELPLSAVLKCRLARSLLEGSHLICIGSVSEVRSEVGNPLLYHDGAFRRLDNENITNQDSPCR
jgi:flavin reductase